MIRKLLIVIAVIIGLCRAEEIHLHGRVLSSDGDGPVVGATISIPHTTIGTASDDAGRFELTFDSTLFRSFRVSAVGFTPVALSVDEFNELNGVIRLIPSPIKAHEVVVTASKRAQPLVDVPASVSIMNAQSFSVRNITSVDDALRYVPGVNFQQSQINIRASSGYSRGVGSRVTLLVDGIPLLAGDTGEITFESIPVFQIARIEVVKGAGSALYGSGALGGVVNVITKDGTSGPSLWWRMYSGVYSPPAYSEWKWSGKTRASNGQYIGFSDADGALSYTVSLHRTIDDGYRENDWMRRYGGYVKATYKFNPYQSLQLSSTFFQQHRGDFLWWNSVKDALRPAEGQRNISVTSLRINSSFDYKHFVNDRLYFDIKGLHFRGNWYRDSLAQTRLDESLSDNFLIDVQGNFIPDEHHTSTFGIVWNNERVRSNIFGRHDGIGGAVYIQDEYKPVATVALTGGIRYDRHMVIGLQEEEQINPKLGLAYTVQEGTTLRASIGRGFRAPSISEYYTSTANTGSAAIVVPNTSLRPEHSWSYETGVSHSLSEFVGIDIALFQNDYADLIEPQVGLDSSISTSSAVISFRNITQARIQGFEAILSIDVLNRSLHSNIHYNYNWAVNTSTGMFLRFRPRHIGGINVSWSYDMLSCGMDFRYISRIEQIDENLVRLAPITNGDARVASYIVDAHLSYKLMDIGIPMSVDFSVNNLLGYNYVELIGNMAPPRQFVLSLEGGL